jgi:chromosome segregation ATPase
MAAMTRVLALLALACSQAAATEVASGTTANPIRRVVTMIQNLKKKVEAEAERDEELHGKFLCYCKTGGSTLETAIATAEANIENLNSALKEAAGEKKQLTADLAQHKSDRAAAKDAIAKATSIRAQEAKAFAKVKSDSETNIAAIKKAVASLEKGMGGSFLQTTSAQTIRDLLLSKDMQDGDREDVMAFLSGQYAPQSGQITGILKQLGDEMTQDLTDATAAEETSISQFNDLVAAKTKEINAATAAIEAKSIRLGEVSVSIAEMTGDLGDTVDSLADDKKFLADLEKNCATAQEKYDAIVKERSDEIVALSETIKILNDDDALELFKKTLPSAASSLMQVQVTEAAVRQRALAVLKKVGRHQPAMDFLELALNGKKIGFGKVLAMIDDMVVSLKSEQQDDNEKKEYCEAELDKSEDKKKAEEQAAADAEAAIDDAKESLAKLAEEIKALQDGIAALDKSVGDATAQRKEENAEYKNLMSGNTAAKELIGVAKNRLNKFYNPKMYKAPPKRELSEEERIAVNNGETLAPTPAPGGIAGTGISAFDQVEPGPAPAQASYGKKSEESNGVIAMLDLLVKDLDKEMQIAETAEKDAQGDYEQAMADAGTKRADDTKTLGDKESAKAETEALLQGHTDDHTAISTELQGTMAYIASLHGECDWLLKNFDARKDARTSEIDALGKAKAVLNGADFSLLQTNSRSLRGHM